MKAIACAIWMLCAGPAMAQWVKYAERPGTASFYDADRVETKASVRKAWVINDFADARPDRSRSALVQSEMDCADQTVRLLYFATYAEPMASGETILDNRPEYLPGPWRPVPSKSLTADLMDQLCAI